VCQEFSASESSDTRRKVARLSPVESATRQLDSVGMLVRLALRESDSITHIIDRKFRVQL